MPNSICAMFSPIYSAAGGVGGVYVPNPMFMPNGAYRGLPVFPPFGAPAFPFAPYFPTGPLPRIGVNGLISGQMNGEGPPQLRKLFIGGLNHETTDEQLRQFYSQWGTVVDCIVIRDPLTKYSRGFGFVTFATIQMAEAAMADRPHTINGKVVDPKRAIPREQMSPLLPNHPPPFLEGEPEPGCKLSLSGIHWDYHTVDGLREYFDKFGIVEQVEILGNPRGLGFVVFEDKAAADRCLAHAKVHVINGRKCEVTRNPIQHSIYQQEDLQSGEREEAEEKEDSGIGIVQETPVKENGSAKSSEVAKSKNASAAAEAEKKVDNEANATKNSRTTANSSKGSEVKKTTADVKKSEKKDTPMKQEKKKTGKKSGRN